MPDFFSRLSGEDVAGIVLAGGTVVFALVLVIAGVWLKIRKAEIDATLKQDMLNRGMSAEEIKAILDAGKKK